MRVSTTVLALAALASSTFAASIHHRHAHMHNKRSPDINEALAGATPVQQTTSSSPTPTPSPAASSNNVVSSWFSELSTLLTEIGIVAEGANPTSSGSGVWIGSDGTYTNTFYNQASETVVLVVWGPQGSWVNTITPLITQAISPGESITLSFANGQSGAFSALYSDTILINGQIFGTWGEYTFAGGSSTVDVSREVNMAGHTLEIKTPQCVTNMNTCVFVCNSGNSCETGYSLENCAIGSQPGANYGTVNYGSGDVPSGGCSGMGNSAQLQTYFS